MQIRIPSSRTVPLAKSNLLANIQRTHSLKRFLSSDFDNLKNVSFAITYLSVQSSMSLLFRKRAAQQLIDITSALLERVQRLEVDQADLRAHVGGKHHMRFLTTEIAAAAQIALSIGASTEAVANSLRTPIPRGRAGGLARARKAWRRSDGTFMPESEKYEAYRKEYERYAAGGRARAGGAIRGPDGTFLSDRVAPE
jgi:hypothetical protein